MVTEKYINALLLICALLALPTSATEKPYRIGILEGPHAWVELDRAISSHLGLLGYEEGKDIVYEGKASSALAHDKLPELAAELVEWNADVIATSDLTAARAAVKATNTVPIVTIALVEPVKAGLVDSIAKPGRNVTGIVLPNYKLIGKKLELLRELAPRLERVGVIFNPSSEHGALAWRKAQVVAAEQGPGVEPLALDVMSDATPALKEALGAKTGVFVVVEDGAAWQHALAINKFAIEHGLPVVYPNAEFVEWKESLISYGPDLLEVRSGVAALVDQILKGADPAELPMQQVTQYALALKRSVAEKMGIEIPPLILARITMIR